MLKCFKNFDSLLILVSRNFFVVVFCQWKVLEKRFFSWFGRHGDKKDFSFRLDLSNFGNVCLEYAILKSFMKMFSSPLIQRVMMKNLKTTFLSWEWEWRFVSIKSAEYFTFLLVYVFFENGFSQNGNLHFTKCELRYLQ